MFLLTRWQNISTADLRGFAVVFFIVTNVALYYEEWSIFILLGQGFIVSAAFFELFRRKLIRDKFLFVEFSGFLALSVLSLFWSVGQDLTLESVIFLAKCIIFSLSLRICLSDWEIVKKTVRYFALSSLIYAIMYLQKIGVDDLAYARLSVDIEGLPNINTVASIVVFPAVFYFSMFIEKRKTIHFLFFVLSAVALVFLGSRRSILITMLVVVATFFLKGKNRILEGALIGAGIFYAVVFLVPAEYLLFNLDRIFSLADATDIDGSDTIRLQLLNFSADMFSNAPVLGNGYYTFSYLNFSHNGLLVYAHNNYMETLVGLGVVGLILYYAVYVRLVRNCFFILKGFSDKSDTIFVYIVSMYLAFQLLGQFFISVTNDRYVWVFLAIASAACYEFWQRRFLIK